MTVERAMPQERRLLVLTQWAAGGRYAGPEALRRTLMGLRGWSIRWACLSPCPGQTPSHAVVRGFHQRWVPWRFYRSSLNHVVRSRVLARRRAGEIAAWCRDFRPDAIWALPELDATTVALHLQRMLGVPMHATVYDAWETAIPDVLPRWQYPLLRGDTLRFFSRVSSFDAVSPELVQHTREGLNLPAAVRSLVLPPSVPAAWIALQPGANDWTRGVRTIGICGAVRTTSAQWGSFLATLGQMPWAIHLRVFAATVPDLREAPPANVTVERCAYVEDEAQLIRELATTDVCYLGLWTDPAHALFARTSLSSKLATYAAAGRPVLVDAPEVSAGWRLVRQYAAGVRVSADVSDAGERIREVLADRHTWWRMSAGAGRLAHEVFNLDSNLPGLLAMLAQTAIRTRWS